jgi:hypothetical protein
MEKILVKKKKLIEINKIRMGIKICIEVPNWLMLEAPSVYDRPKGF